MNITPFDLPEASPYFQDYLHNFDRLKAFYAHPWRDAWAPVVARRGAYSYPREQLVALLKSQHRRYRGGDAALANIELLAAANTLAVVSGQQAGLLGGPLYTIYKTITAIKLAASLGRQFPQKCFVPVFWLEVNDSDFEEIRHVHLIDQTNEMRVLSAGENEGEDQLGVHARRIDPAMNGWPEQLRGWFPDNDFRDAMIDFFLRDYLSAEAYGHGLAGLMARLFERHGLVIIDPSGPEMAGLVAPLYQRALDGAAELREIFQRRTAAIENAGYTTLVQARPEQTFLFFNDSDRRRVRVDQDESGNFQLKYADGYRPISRAALLAAGETYLTPNVVLRPLVQDTLLPSVAYVAGGGEIAYWGQIASIYEALDVPMPVVYPRHRLTLVESRIQRIVEKLDLRMEGLLTAGDDFIAAFIRGSVNQKLFDDARTAAQQITAALQSLQAGIAAVDPTLQGALEKTQQNIEKSFQNFEGRLTRALEQRHQTSVQQVERVLRSLRPGGKPQERVLTLMNFAVKYGLSFVDELVETLPDDPAPHYGVEL